MAGGHFGLQTGPLCSTGLLCRGCGSAGWVLRPRGCHCCPRGGRPAPALIGPSGTAQTPHPAAPSLTPDNTQVPAMSLLVFTWFPTGLTDPCPGSPDPACLDCPDRARLDCWPRGPGAGFFFLKLQADSNMQPGWGPTSHSWSSKGTMSPRRLWHLQPRPQYLVGLPIRSIKGKNFSYFWILQKPRNFSRGTWLALCEVHRALLLHPYLSQTRSAGSSWGPRLQGHLVAWKQVGSRGAAGAHQVLAAGPARRPCWPHGLGAPRSSERQAPQPRGTQEARPFLSPPRVNKSAVDSLDALVFPSVLKASRLVQFFILATSFIKMFSALRGDPA